MGRRVNVSPEVLASKASTIRNLSKRYQHAYQRIYRQVDGLRAGWRGADNDAFTAQIQGFRQEFDDMTELMEQCALFLETSAAEYSKVQEDAIKRASRL